MIVRVLERRDGPPLDLANVLPVAQRWREALLSLSNDKSAEARRQISGHEADGTPLTEPHLALAPFASVDHPHADGQLLAMAVVLPRELSPDLRRELIQIVGRVEELKLGRLGAWWLAEESSNPVGWALDPERLTGEPAGTTHWATLTPVVFDRHPKASDPAEVRREVSEMIAATCPTIGLPRPREVLPSPVSTHLGVPPAHAFPRLRRKDSSEPRHTHAILIFDHAVRGPMLLGAGRYRGYGVCSPMLSGEEISG